jgi:hypothetical protein
MYGILNDLFAKLCRAAFETALVYGNLDLSVDGGKEPVKR